MNRDRTITELLHELTQARRVVTFSRDFSGMITAAVDDDHDHLNYPHGSLKELEKAIVHYLAEKLYSDQDNGTD